MRALVAAPRALRGPGQSDPLAWRMRILFIHSRYQIPGGEEAVVEAEIHLLRSRGHDVFRHERDNHEVSHRNRLGLLRDTLWSTSSHRAVQQLVTDERIQVVHVHNTLPLVSPSVYWAASRAGAAVVQTLHNFRWLCPQGTLLRDGRICESCVGKVPWRAIQHRCYRDSAVQSAVMSATYGLHTALGSLHQQADRIVALTDFARNKFIEGGFPPDKMVVKPNFVEDSAVAAAPDTSPTRSGVLYAGRLSEEKGPDVLVDAAGLLPDETFELLGHGPLADVLTQPANVTFPGAVSKTRVLDAMQQAMVLVLPSRCYEGLPMTLVEAFCQGLPVIASRLGAFPSLIDDGVTGLLFEPGNAKDLADKLRWCRDHPDAVARMGLAARATYLRRYTAQSNYTQLLAIYQDAILHRQAR
jgi:glycosyltransferase involved in cell wall biosynthesis